MSEGLTLAGELFAVGGSIAYDAGWKAAEMTVRDDCGSGLERDREGGTVAMGVAISHLGGLALLQRLRRATEHADPGSAAT